MADSFILTDGTTSIELKYDPGTQDEYRITYGTRVQQMMPDVLVHEPDDGESLPVRAVERDRQIFTELQVVADTWDEVLNKVTELRRLLDQGLRYWIDGDVDRVTFRIQLDGATRYTDWPVKWGFIDDSASYYTTAQNKLAWDLVIGMTVSPYGEGAPFTLRNALASSPHFIEDSDGNGLADGWNDINTPTLTIDTTYYLVGGKSQKVTTDASTGEGISSDIVTVATTTDLVAYIWVYAAAAGNDPLRVRLYDGSSNLVEEKTFNPASPTGYDKTATGAAGETWYRYSFVSTATRTAANAYIAVLRISGEATQVTDFYVDAAYMETSQDTVPAAWSSTAGNLEDRYDPTTSDEARIDYLDIWGVMGDAPAALDMSILPTRNNTNTDAMIYIGGADIKKYPAWFLKHYLETGISDAGNGTSSTPSDSSRSSGSYSRLTANASSVTDATGVVGMLDTYWQYWQDQPRRMLLIARSSSAATSFELQPTAGVYSTTAEPVTLNNPNVWELIDLGTILPGVSRPFDTYGGFVGEDNIFYTITPGATSATVDVDAVILLPVYNDKLLIALNSGGSGTMYTNSAGKYVYGSDEGIVKSLGGIWEIEPQTETRLVFATALANGAHDLDNQTFVTLTVTPRTRHLLGTV